MAGPGLEPGGAHGEGVQLLLQATGPDGETVTEELDLDEAAAMAGEAAEALNATFQNIADSVHVEGDPGKFTTSFSLGEAGPGEDDEEVEVMLSPAQALNLFRFIVLFLVFSQVALMVWKHRRPKSYAYVTVTALWAVPAFLSLESRFWRFLLVWAAYSGYSLKLMRACRVRPMDKNTPRRVYAWFLGVHKVSVGVGALGYFWIFLGVLTFTLSTGFPFTLLFYGLYFGVLGRDCAEVCTDFIQNNLGTQKSLGLRAGTCAICGDGLKEAFIVADRTTEETVCLPGCGHKFHDLCIRGWTIVGKKDTCPFCKEKVSLKQLHKQRPWESSNVTWNRMLDLVRYLVAWNPIIILVLHFAIKWSHILPTIASVKTPG